MGAEALLGMGDMLYMPSGTGYPTRVHGAFVSDDEVHRVVSYLKEQGGEDYIDGVLDGGASEVRAATSLLRARAVAARRTRSTTRRSRWCCRTARPASAMCSASSRSATNRSARPAGGQMERGRFGQRADRQRPARHPGRRARRRLSVGPGCSLDPHFFTSRPFRQLTAGAALLSTMQLSKHVLRLATPVALLVGAMSWAAAAPRRRPVRPRELPAPGAAAARVHPGRDRATRRLASHMPRHKDQQSGSLSSCARAASASLPEALRAADRRRRPDALALRRRPEPGHAARRQQEALGNSPPR